MVKRRGNGRLWRRLARAPEAVAARRAMRRHRSRAGAVPRLRFDHAARLMRENAEGSKSRRVPRGCAPRGAGGARVRAKVHERQAQAVVGKAARTRARTRTEARATIDSPSCYSPLHVRRNYSELKIVRRSNHTYPKTDNLEYSLAFSHNSYSYPLTLLVHYHTHSSYPQTTEESAPS